MHMSMLVKGPAVQTSCSKTLYRLLPMIYDSRLAEYLYHTKLPNFAARGAAVMPSSTNLHTNMLSVSIGLNIWWHNATLFVYFSYFITYIHSFIQSHSCNTFIHRHLLRPLSISSSLVCSVGKHLPVVPRRESTSGLPYSKPTRYQLSHAAPLSHTAPRLCRKSLNLLKGRTTKPVLYP